MTTATKPKTATVSFPLKDFKAAFSAVAKAAPNRAARSVLLCIRLDLAEGEATLTSTNLEMWIIHRMACGWTEEPTSILLPRSAIQDILRVAGGDTIELAVNGPEMQVRAGSSKWNLNTDDPDIFPAPPPIDQEAFHEVEAGRLALAIKRTVKEARPGASAVIQFEPMLTALCLTSSNGCSLAHQQVEAACVQPFVLIDPLPLVPDTAIRTLQSFLPDSTEVVRVGFPNKNWAWFQAAGTTLLCRLAEGTFVKWRAFVDRFPKPVGTMTAECKPIRLAVARACVSLDDSSRALDMMFTSKDLYRDQDTGLLRLEAASGKGKSEVDEPIEWEGEEELEVTVDPQYLVGMLGSLGDDTAIKLEVYPDRIPMKLTTEDGFLGLSQLMDRRTS